MSNETPEADNTEARWPMDADRLFVESTWAHDALVVGDPEERFYRLPMGYERAGDILIAQAGTDVVDRKNITYAAIFCYRQSIELFLKKLIEDFDAEKPKNTHDLGLLWQEFMRIVNEHGASKTVGLGAVQQLVAEMHEADRKSDGFRFPTDRDGAPFAFGDRDIDLTNLRDIMQGLVNFFECAHLEFSQQNDTASET